MKTIFGFLLLCGQVANCMPLGPSSFSLGDRLYSERQEEVKARRAFEIYKGLAEQGDSIEALWRLAMAAQFVGMRYEKLSSEREKFFEIGKEAGLKAIKLHPDCGPCHFWTAVNMALYGKEVGILKMLFTLKEVQGHLSKSASLSPDYALGGAYRILGLIERNLPGILGGSDERAVEYLEKAIKVAPGASLNYLFLSRILRDGFSERKKALALAEKGASLPLFADAPFEEREARAEISILIEELRKPVTRPVVRSVNR